MKTRNMKLNRIWIPALVLALAMSAGCSSGGDEAADAGAGEGKTLAEVQARDGLEGSSGLVRDPAPLPDPKPQYAEGSGGKMDDHPNVGPAEVLEREVFVPDNVQGKWKAVKLLVKNKRDESLNEMRTVALGDSFEIPDAGFKITVGPFFPNFVMSERSYTSMNNQLINPAVQLVVEEKGKVIYKGWTFKKFPNLYSFEHEAYALELVESIPADVS